MTAATASPTIPRALAAKMRRRAPLRGFWRAAPCKQARARIHPRTRSARVNTSRGNPARGVTIHIEGNRKPSGVHLVSALGLSKEMGPPKWAGAALLPQG